MSFAALQSGFYFATKHSDQTLLGFLNRGMRRAAQSGFRLVPVERHTIRILKEESAAALKKRGGLLLLKETQASPDAWGHEATLNVFLINTYPGISFVKMDLVLPLPSKAIVRAAYRILKGIVKDFLLEGTPNLVALNGLDDEEEVDDLPHPTQWNHQTPPPFWTPFNYVRDGLVKVEKLNELSAFCSVQPFGGGHLLEFVESIEEPASQKIIQAVRDWYLPARTKGYSQITL